MQDILKEGLEALSLPTDGIPSLCTFSQMLLEKNAVMNLTRITDPKEIATRHFLDSVTPLTYLDFHGKTCIDVGTGAGFPGLPLSIVAPDIKMTLLDSLQKRVGFLQEVCDSLQLTHVTCVHGRAEEFAQEHREQYDIATSRAVANLQVLCELCLPLVKVGGTFVSIKSEHSDEELAQAEHAIAILGGKVEKVLDFKIATTDIPSRIILIKKVKETAKKYPRTFAKIKKSPL